MSWDTETADKCRLPELIPKICDNCRDHRYCHKQMTFEDLFRKEGINGRKELF